jgi:hypothetical protein
LGDVVASGALGSTKLDLALARLASAPDKNTEPSGLDWIAIARLLPISGRLIVEDLYRAQQRRPHRL